MAYERRHTVSVALYGLIMKIAPKALIRGNMVFNLVVSQLRAEVGNLYHDYSLAFIKCYDNRFLQISYIKFN